MATQSALATETHSNQNSILAHSFPGSHEKSLVLYLSAVICGLFVSLISWPGFMTFDSIYALEQARHGIIAVTYPPMVSYVWWLVEKIIPGQGGMFLLQNICIFLGIAKVANELNVKKRIALTAFILTALCPATLGPMLVVWKDIAFGGLLALAAGFSLAYDRKGKWWNLSIALLLISLAAAYRLNGLPATPPLIYLLLRRVLRRFDLNSRKLFLVQAACTAIITLFLAAFVIGLSIWRLPDFKRMSFTGNNTLNDIHDLTGISVCSNVNFVPLALYPAEQAGNTTWLRNIYNPKHVQLYLSKEGNSQTLLDPTATPLEATLKPTRYQAIRNYPGCYLRHRAMVTKYLLGLNQGKVFYVTDPVFFPNDLGVGGRNSELTLQGLQWIEKTSDTLLARVWFFLLIASAVIAWAAFHRRLSLFPVVVYLSGLSYLFPGMILLHATDLRYQFWVVIAMQLTILGIIVGQVKTSVSATPLIAPSTTT